MLLTGSNLHKQFTDKPILRDEFLTIDRGEKVALIGVNGCGKSTILKILDGSESYEGKIIQASGSKIARLPQMPSFSQKTVWEEMIFTNSLNDHPLEEYELKTILNRLSLDEADLIVNLSGGQARRLSLAICLAKRPDLFLLDEPTNHLDASMIDWLETYLSKSSAAVLLISHDRYFLDRLCTRIYELENGTLYEHKDGYQGYLENKAKRQELLMSEQKKHKNLYRQELAWVRAGVQARGTKQKARLDQFEKLRQKRFEFSDGQVEFLLPSIRLGDKTIQWQDLSFGYEKENPLFEYFTYTLKKKDRIGIVGKNGSGKSTFLKLLAKEIQPTSGILEEGSTVRIGYFKQDHEIEDESMRVLEYIEESAKVIESTQGKVSASQMLERFLFAKDKQYLPIERLSGGERRRLYLLKVLMEAPNVLLLDEPTNDLDIITLEVLENYLDEFNGIVITISHDRYFLDRVCDNVFVLDQGIFTPCKGGYTDYIVSQHQEKEKPVKEKTGYKKPRFNSFSSKEKRELEILPEKMEQVEASIEELNHQMGLENDYVKIQALSLDRERLEEQLETMTSRWLELEEKREASLQK